MHRSLRPWLRTLSKPPLHLHEEDWPLIEHIRMTGQIGSGAWVANDDPHGARIWSYNRLGGITVDRNASERADIEARAKRDRMLAEMADVAREARRQRQLRERWRTLDREQYYAELTERERQEDERRRIEHARRIEQERRDREWNAAARKQIEQEQLSELFTAPWIGDGAEQHVEARKVVIEQLAGEFAAGDLDKRAQIVTDICAWFPHMTGAIRRIARQEFTDIDFLRSNSIQRRNMGFYQMLWLRTRFLAGFK